MIRYTLRCEKGHDFDGWFQSSDGFDTLRKAGRVSCTNCGSTNVEKTLMAPNVARGGETQPLHNPRDDREAALAKMRKHVEENSDYVGLSFANEARAMHEGRAPERAIYGEAALDDARQLIEDGIQVAPLPFMPRQRAN